MIFGSNYICRHEFKVVITSKMMLSQTIYFRMTFASTIYFRMILAQTIYFRMTANMSDVKKAMMETQDGGKVRNPN